MYPAMARIGRITDDPGGFVEMGPPDLAAAYDRTKRARPSGARRTVFGGRARERGRTSWS
jgi:hypothetical protein